jgi:hypothetical protein
MLISCLKNSCINSYDEKNYCWCVIFLVENHIVCCGCMLPEPNWKNGLCLYIAITNSYQHARYASHGKIGAVDFWVIN